MTAKESGELHGPRPARRGALADAPPAGDGAAEAARWHERLTAIARPGIARQVTVAKLGRLAYPACAWLQAQLQRARQAASIGDLLLFVEHPPVYTMSRRTPTAHLVASVAARAAAGIEVVATDRGGDVTYHGPGQIVGYPILELGDYRRDVHWYVRALEEAIVRALATFGVRAGRFTGYTGVWVDRADWRRAPTAADTLDACRSAGVPPAFVPAPRQPTADAPDFAQDPAADLAKLAAIGVRLGHWVTKHGFALNRAPNLAHYAGIVPCGIRDAAVTSLEALGLTPLPTRAAVLDALARGFAQVFDATLRHAGEPD